MTSTDAPLGIRDLLAHRAWVRRLALALTRDPEAADDVEQQTWLAALRKPPRGDVPPRGWLTTVVHNAVRQRHRSATRRARREAAVARPEAEAGGDPAELTARAELHARIAAAVVELDEPYRGAILLRHFEERSVAQVARSTGVPLETARARLRRGRALLRERLTGEFGDGRPLAVVLLPLTRSETVGSATVTGTTAGAVLGGVVMSTKVLAGGVVLALVGAGAWWFAAERETSQAIEPEPVGEAAARVGSPRSDGARMRRRHDEPASTEEGVADTAGQEPDAPTEPAEASGGKTIEERLAREVPGLFSEEPLRQVLGRLSADLDVPIHVQRPVLDLLDGEEAQVTLRLQGQVTGRVILKLLTQFRALELDLLEEHVVIRRWKDAPTTAETRTFLIEPIPVDPSVPTTVMVHARVLHSDGTPAAGVRIEGQGVPEEVTDSAGFIRFESPAREVGLRALLAFHEPSARWSEKAEFGDLLEPVLVLGPPAGAVDVTVTSGGKPIEGAVVRISWFVPTDGGGFRKVAADPSWTDGAGKSKDEHVAATDVQVLVYDKGCAPETRTAKVTVGDRQSLAIELRKEALSARLKRARTTFRFEGTAVDECVQFLSNTQFVNIVVMPDASEALAGKKVWLSVTDTAVDQALRELCASVGGIALDIDDEKGYVALRLATK